MFNQAKWTFLLLRCFAWNNALESLVNKVYRKIEKNRQMEDNDEHRSRPSTCARYNNLRNFCSLNWTLQARAICSSQLKITRDYLISFARLWTNQLDSLFLSRFPNICYEKTQSFRAIKSDSFIRIINSKSYKLIVWYCDKATCFYSLIILYIK